MSVKVMDLVFESDVKPANMKFALLALADNASHTGFCRPGVNYLAAKTGTSRSTMFRLLSQLESEHLIERRERRRSDGSRQANAYRINVELLRRRSRTVTPDEKDELEKLFQEESAEVGDMVPGCDGGDAVDLDDLDESIFASSQDETGAWVTSETGGSVVGDTGARPGDDTGKNRQEDRQLDRHGTHAAPEAESSDSKRAQKPIEMDSSDIPKNTEVILDGSVAAGDQDRHPDEGQHPGDDFEMDYSVVDPEQAMIDWSSRPRSTTRSTSRYLKAVHTPAARELVGEYLKSAQAPMARESKEALLSNVTECQKQGLADWAILTAIPRCLAKCHPNALPGFVTIVLNEQVPPGKASTTTTRFQQQVKDHDDMFGPDGFFRDGPDQEQAAVIVQGEVVRELPPSACG